MLAKMPKNRKFLLEAAAIFLAYFYYGILQEEVTKSKYTYETTDDKGETIYLTEKYSYFLALVFTLSVINYVVAALVLKVCPQDEDKTSRGYYVSVATTYLLAMVSSMMALQWVPYPTQVVGKSAKPIPVMILGVLLGNKSYPFKKYIFVLIIIIGAVLFIFKDKGESTQQDLGFSLGELLLIFSLTMDGLLGGVQVSDFGPLVVSVVTTTRKFFTVLASVIIFGNALSVRQWIGTVLVFSGLFLDAFFSEGSVKNSPGNKS